MASPCDLLVFSHCGRTSLASSSASDVLSEQDMRTNLIASGISAFDMDLVATTDGHLVVGHPVSMARALGYDVRSATLRKVRHSTAQRHPLLLADQLLNMARETNITIALDLKGNGEPSMLAHVQHLARGILARGISDRAWLWLESATTAWALRHLLGNLAFRKLVLLKPLRDRLAPAVSQASERSPDCSVQVAGGGYNWASMLGPSAKCIQSRLLDSPHARQWAGPRKYLTWVVDDEAEMVRVLGLGVDMVISNEPLVIAAAARRRCRAQRHRAGRVLA